MKRQLFPEKRQMAKIKLSTSLLVDTACLVYNFNVRNLFVFMGKKIKKIAKNKIIAVFSLGSFVFAVALRLFLGNSHLNISQLNSKANDINSKIGPLVNSARADVPYSGGCSTTSCSACGCGEGGEGSGGGY
jgi:hypothetical protein